jgi:hypothetical protein
LVVRVRGDACVAEHLTGTSIHMIYGR